MNSEWRLYLVLYSGGSFKKRVNIGTVKNDKNRDERIESMVTNYAINDKIGSISFSLFWRHDVQISLKSVIIARQADNLSPLTYYQFEAEFIGNVVYGVDDEGFSIF